MTNGTRKIAPWKIAPRKVAPALTLNQPLTLTQGGGYFLRERIFRGAILPGTIFLSLTNYLTHICSEISKTRFIL